MREFYQQDLTNRLDTKTGYEDSDLDCRREEGRTPSLQHRKSYLALARSFLGAGEVPSLESVALYDGPGNRYFVKRQTKDTWITITQWNEASVKTT